MIIPMTKEHTLEVAEIHMKQFPEYFTSMFGITFLKTLNDSICEDTKSFGFVYVKDKKVLGYVSGISNKAKLLKKNIFKLGIIMLPFIIKKPSILKDIYKAIISEDEAFPELFSIVVHSSLRGEGIGRQFIMKLNEKFLDIDIKKYRLHVGANIPAVKFYKKMGFIYKRTETWTNNKMYVMEYNIKELE